MHRSGLACLSFLGRMMVNYAAMAWRRSDSLGRVGAVLAGSMACVSSAAVVGRWGKSVVSGVVSWVGGDRGRASAFVLGECCL
jgi:hypothetical protein